MLWILAGDSLALVTWFQQVLLITWRDAIYILEDIPRVHSSSKTQSVRSNKGFTFPKARVLERRSYI